MAREINFAGAELCDSIDLVRGDWLFCNSDKLGDRGVGVGVGLCGCKAIKTGPGSQDMFAFTICKYLKTTCQLLLCTSVTGLMSVTGLNLLMLSSSARAKYWQPSKELV